MSELPKEFWSFVREQARLRREWRPLAEAVAEAAEKLLGECEVYVFGSVAEGRQTAASDVDVLIIAEKLPQKPSERRTLKIRIEDEANLPEYHPVQIHLITKEEAKENPIYKNILKGTHIKIHTKN